MKRFVTVSMVAGCALTLATARYEPTLMRISSQSDTRGPLVM